VIRIHLPEAEAARLEQAFRQATDRKPGDRLQIILMAHRGRPHREIARVVPSSGTTFVYSPLFGPIGA
jgi:hypothetical protein